VLDDKLSKVFTNPNRYPIERNHNVIDYPSQIG